MARSTNGNSKLVEYLSKATEKEREIESALAAQIVMATRPGYQRRLESYLEETKVRVERLEQRISEVGGRKPAAAASGAGKQAKDAARTVADRAQTLAKGSVDAMRTDQEAGKLLENARLQFAGASEQVGNYRVVRSLAKVAGDRPTAKLAKGFRRQHEDLGEYVSGVIPKLSKAAAKAEAKGASSSKRSTGARGRSSSSRNRSPSAGRAATTRRKPTSARSGGGTARKRPSSARSGGGGTARKRSTSSRSGGGAGTRRKATSRS